MFFFFFFGFSKLIENFQTRSYPRFKSYDSQTYAALQIFWQSQNYVLMIKIYIYLLSTFLVFCQFVV